MRRFVVPEGWVVQAYRFALDPTPSQHRALAMHCGAARFAFNHMLALVKAVLDQRAAERSYGLAEAELTPALGWSLPALRRAWNARKDKVAPWWTECSKEAFNTGLDGLARALDAWAKSKAGARRGPRVGFPRFKSKAGSRASVRFATGAIRVEPDQRHVTLPRLGAIKSHETTHKLAARLAIGTARVLAAVVTRDRSGRWHCAFQVLVCGKAGSGDVQRSAVAAVGVDVGVRDLLVVATPDGAEVKRLPAPRSLTKARSRLRRLQRRAAKQRGPYDAVGMVGRVSSGRWRRTQARIAKLHVRAANTRRDALHKATTALARQHRVITVERLNVAGMRANGGTRKRGLNRALADAALAEVRRMLDYKTQWYGSVLVEADRWFPSSRTCSACGTVKAKLSLGERRHKCETCGVILDRDLNAAVNLARLGDATGQVPGGRGPAGSGPVAGRGANQKTTVHAGGRRL